MKDNHRKSKVTEMFDLDLAKQSAIKGIEAKFVIENKINDKRFFKLNFLKAKFEKINSDIRPLLEKRNNDKVYSEICVRKELYKRRLECLKVKKEINFSLNSKKVENTILENPVSLKISKRVRAEHFQRSYYNTKQSKNRIIVEEDEQSDNSIDYSLIPLVINCF